MSPTNSLRKPTASSAEPILVESAPSPYPLGKACIFHEMMVHPACFTHGAPKHVGIMGEETGLLDELIKYTEMTAIYCFQFEQTLPKADKRIHHQSVDALLAKRVPSSTLDILFMPQAISLETNWLEAIHHALSPNGLFVLSGRSPLVDFEGFSALRHRFLQNGFGTLQVLTLPRLVTTDTIDTLFLVSKAPAFNRLREKQIYNRPFTTHYYNFDTHKAALAVPDFLRLVLET